MRVIVKMIVMVIIRVKIVYIGILMRLVSRSGNDESKRINNDDKDENDSIEKEDYKYNEDKCNNKDNDDDDSDNDD